MMKILYIGHYREGTGWSQAAIDYILALDTAGVDVVCRPVKLNDHQPNLPERILELEQKSSKNSTHCIQHVLPHYMDYNGKLKNIALFVTETDSIFWTGWPARLKVMDEIWVPNNEMVKVCKESVPYVPVRVVPHACDITKYGKDYSAFDLSIMEDRHLFYFIGEFSRRKRVSAILQAYYLAFDRNENVGLVLKVNKPGQTAEETFSKLVETDKLVKENLRLYLDDKCYPPVYFITSYMAEDQLYALHKKCNTFVTLTYGDAWCIPAFDALGFGNSVISSNCGGMADFVASYDNSLVKGTWQPVFGADVVLADLNTGRENWFMADINEVVDAMRYQYSSAGMYMCGFQSGLRMDALEKLFETYSYEAVGNKMKALLGENSK